MQEVAGWLRCNGASPPLPPSSIRHLEALIERLVLPRGTSDSLGYAVRVTLDGRPIDWRGLTACLYGRDERRNGSDTQGHGSRPKRQRRDLIAFSESG